MLKFTYLNFSIPLNINSAIREEMVYSHMRSSWTDWYSSLHQRAGQHGWHCPPLKHTLLSTSWSWASTPSPCSSRAYTLGSSAWIWCLSMCSRASLLLGTSHRHPSVEMDGPLAEEQEGRLSSVSASPSFSCLPVIFSPSLTHWLCKQSYSWVWLESGILSISILYRIPKSKRNTHTQNKT